MRNLKTPEQTAQENKEVTLYLDAIESLIKTEAYREVGNEMFSKLDSATLTPKNLVRYYYLNGRYFLYLFRLENDIEDLEYANSFFDDMATKAYELGYIIDDCRFLFSRAHTKFQLAGLVWEEERKPWLLKKVKHITETVLRFDSGNQSFLWLKQQLIA